MKWYLQGDHGYYRITDEDGVFITAYMSSDYPNLRQIVNAHNNEEPRARTPAEQLLNQLGVLPDSHAISLVNIALNKSFADGMEREKLLEKGRQLVQQERLWKLSEEWNEKLRKL